MYNMFQPQPHSYLFLICLSLLFIAVIRTPGPKATWGGKSLLQLASQSGAGTQDRNLEAESQGGTLLAGLISLLS